MQATALIAFIYSLAPLLLLQNKGLRSPFFCDIETRHWVIRVLRFEKRNLSSFEMSKKNGLERHDINLLFYLYNRYVRA
jgi:hypothetical protein